MPIRKILHIAPANTSNVPWQLVRAERQLGFDSRLLTLFQDPRNYEQDICLNLPFIDMAPTRWIKRWVSNPDKLRVVNVAPVPESIPIVWRPHSLAENMLVNFRDWLWRPKIQTSIQKYNLQDFDLYQLDGGLGLYRNAAFIQRMKSAGKKMICCYTGSDLRTRGVIEVIDRLSDLNVTVEFDHLQLHPNIFHVFFPFDATPFAAHSHHQNKKPVRIGHAPTNRAAKGSDVIIPILKEIEQELGTETVLIEGLPYQEALKLKRSCDIFVDQIGDLGYGINSLEAFAMGIPACSCLAPGFAEMYPQHPFVDINAKNLKDQLRRLVHQPELRRHIGQEGKQWVQRLHDARRVVEKIHALAGISRPREEQ